MSTSLQLRQFDAQLNYKAVIGEISSNTVHLQLADAIDLHVLDQKTALDAIVGVPKDAPLVEIRINRVHIELWYSLIPQFGRK